MKSAEISENKMSDIDKRIRVFHIGGRGGRGSRSSTPGRRPSWSGLGHKGSALAVAASTMTNLVVFLPMTYPPSTAGPSQGVLVSPTINIPNDPRLGNLVFYSQPFCPDKKLNGFDQIYMGWANKWTIGSGTGPKGTVVYRTGNNASTTGSVRSGYGRTMLLQ